MMPDLNRMNPMSSSALYGPGGPGRVHKSLLRVAFVGVAAGLVVWTGFDTLRGLIHRPLETAITDGLGFTLRLLLATAGAMLVLAAIDAPYQRWNWMRKLKMTREELRREMKESERQPEVKGRIRQLQQQMANRRMMERYAGGGRGGGQPPLRCSEVRGRRHERPHVVALGVDETALRIREVADGNKVAIVSAPPLARALYREGQLGRKSP